MGAHGWPSGGRRATAYRVAVAAALAVVGVTVSLGVGVAAEPTAAPRHLVEGTPCTSTARACVDLDSDSAWLLDGGTVVRGPVPVRVGAPDYPTPTGTFAVQWKAEQYTSREYGVRMPYSVFFADGGIAFHEGLTNTDSAGCVKLGHDDAVAWFDQLHVGDQVQVH